MNDKVEIIPDFFYEFISRIIPGCVLLGFLMLCSDVEWDEIYKKFGLGEFTLVLIAAWVVGITLDVVPFVVLRVSSKQLFKRISPPIATLQHIRKMKAWERGRIRKAEAQIVFFRSMSIICVIAGSLAARSLPHFTRGETVCWLFLLLFAVLFGLCWKNERKALQDWVSLEETQRETRAN